ncbi:6-pyruvoyl trahydropterin synthase family protein [Eisenibacter elegans]|jgi:6-pyruvoyltetrahydropterin/6-carboxytetrahydropterin synthase|uniref:6-pyruvoyl trahydropterin synthase family protein n=1 Tax=Eisenibacter elegans TaxID=997 RepID=UPI00047A3050|nr:6-carboxytetrahydropterin synthase [Eisenibacter elegans]
MVYVCRKEHFNAAHRLYNPAWTKEKNQEVFGICSNEYFHGHNFELIVTVKGHPQPDTGCVIDLKVLSSIIKREVIDKLDHRNMNIEVDFLQGKIPSCEVVVIEIWKILAKALSDYPHVQLHKLQLFETNKNFVEYYGE